jgi:hypothetical protein
MARPDMANAADERSRRRNVVVTALVLGAIATAFFLGTFLRHAL